VIGSAVVVAVAVAAAAPDIADAVVPTPVTAPALGQTWAIVDGRLW